MIVDWMNEVGKEYKLSSVTVHLAVNYLDRILGQLAVHKTRLQLVSMSCVLLAGMLFVMIHDFICLKQQSMKRSLTVFPQLRT